MNTDLLRTITTNEVETYHRDGVLKLSGMFDKDWIELLNNEKAFMDLGSGFVVVQLNFFRQGINQQVSALD